VEPDALAIGRGRQENKPGYAPKLKERALAIKAAKAAAKNRGRPCAESSASSASSPWRTGSSMR
jgi:hypothetical protein